jgi:hypothetical protein
MKNVTLVLSLFLCLNIIAKAQENGNLPLIDTEWSLTNLNEKVINKNEEGLASFIVFFG